MQGEPEDDENAVTPKKPAPQPEKKPDEAGQQPDKPKEEDGPSEVEPGRPAFVPGRDTAVTMGVLKNPRHEAFCQARALGRTLDQAYSEAGFKPSRQHAQRLATKGYILKRLAELQNHTVELFEITAEAIAKQLDEDRKFAYKCKVPSAAVQASVAKGRLAGLFVEHASVQVSHNYSMMTEEEIRFELAALNAEARSLKPGVQH